jgi:hypothetical protein
MCSSIRSPISSSSGHPPQPDRDDREPCFLEALLRRVWPLRLPLTDSCYVKSYHTDLTCVFLCLKTGQFPREPGCRRSATTCPSSGLRSFESYCCTGPGAHSGTRNCTRPCRFRPRDGRLFYRFSRRIRRWSSSFTGYSGRRVSAGSSGCTPFSPSCWMCAPREPRQVAVFRSVDSGVRRRVSLSASGRGWGGPAHGFARSTPSPNQRGERIQRR